MGPAPLVLPVFSGAPEVGSPQVQQKHWVAWLTGCSMRPATVTLDRSTGRVEVDVLPVGSEGRQLLQRRRFTVGFVSEQTSWLLVSVIKHIFWLRVSKSRLQSSRCPGRFPWS